MDEGKERTILYHFPVDPIRAGIFKMSMGARNRGGIGLSYRPARLHRLAEFRNEFRGPINILKYGLRSLSPNSMPS